MSSKKTRSSRRTHSSPLPLTATTRMQATMEATDATRKATFSHHAQGRPGSNRNPVAVARAMLLMRMSVLALLSANWMRPWLWFRISKA